MTDLIVSKLSASACNRVSNKRLPLIDLIESFKQINKRTPYSDQVQKLTQLNCFSKLIKPHHLRKFSLSKNHLQRFRKHLKLSYGKLHHSTNFRRYIYTVATLSIEGSLRWLPITQLPNLFQRHFLYNIFYCFVKPQPVLNCFFMIIFKHYNYL